MMKIQNQDNFATTKAALSGLAGAVTTIATANTLQYCVNGIALTAVAIVGGAMPIVDHATLLPFPALAANQGTVIVFGLDAAGTLRVCQGSIEALDSAGNFFRAPQFPVMPDTDTPFAYAIIKDGATGGPFTVGTSVWNTVGLTYSIKDVMMLPDRPVSS
jgi:hypothetical protein